MIPFFLQDEVDGKPEVVLADKIVDESAEFSIFESEVDRGVRIERVQWNSNAQTDSKFVDRFRAEQQFTRGIFGSDAEVHLFEELVGERVRGELGA